MELLRAPSVLDAGISEDNCGGSRVDKTHGNVAIIKKASFFIRR